MNVNTFITLIKDPAQLYKISYTELESLVSQYPYCQNLRYLLLKKCTFEENEDFAKNLELTATFSNDRNLLFKQIHNQKENNGKPDVFHTNQKDQKPEEKLEQEKKFNVAEELLEEVNSETQENKVKVEQDIEPNNISKNEAIEEIELNSLFENEKSEDIVSERQSRSIVPNYFDENDSDAEFEDITEEMEFEFDLKEIPNKDQLLDEENVISIEELFELDSTIQSIPPEEDKRDILETIVEQKPKEIKSRNKKSRNKKGKPLTKKKVFPTPKSAFGSWVEKFQEPDVDEKTDKKKESEKRKKKLKKKLKKKESVSKKQKKKKHLKKGKKTIYFAQQSLRENKEIVSETLANVLVSQESYEKAVEMFEKLSLIFPEKSSYFAVQIKKLKK